MDVLSICSLFYRHQNSGGQWPGRKPGLFYGVWGENMALRLYICLTGGGKSGTVKACFEPEKAEIRSNAFIEACFYGKKINGQEILPFRQ